MQPRRRFGQPSFGLLRNPNVKSINKLVVGALASLSGCTDSLSCEAAHLGMPRASAQSQYSWTTVLEAKSGLRFEMPGTPRQETIGEHYRSYELQRDAARYFVQFTFFYGADKTEADLGDLLAQFGKTLDGGRWRSLMWGRRDGLLVGDGVGVQSGHDVRYVAAAKGALVIDLVYEGPIGTARSSDVHRFIGSLRKVE
jgi:hypothetical protein